MTMNDAIDVLIAIAEQHVRDTIKSARSIPDEKYQQQTAEYLAEIEDAITTAKGWSE